MLRQQKIFGSDETACHFASTHFRSSPQYLGYKPGVTCVGNRNCHGRCDIRLSLKRRVAAILGALREVHHSEL